MADLSNYTSVFKTNNPDHPKRVIKRNRPVASCSSCHLKKIKCDRQQPCSACTKRGEGAFCRFSSGPVRNDERSKSEAQARLQKLEDMVNSLMKNGAPPSPPKSSAASGVEVRIDSAVESPSTDSRASTSGHINNEGTETSYVGATGWQAVLESIHDIREYLHTDDTNGGSPPEEASPAVTDPLLGTMEPLSREEAFASLPPRHVCDSLMSIFFSNMFITVHFIHSRKFRREYDRFWQDPSSTHFLWISQLFSMLSIASFVANKKRLGAALHPSVTSPDIYNFKAGQCLCSGAYIKAQPGSIEALLLYAYSKFLNGREIEAPMWATFSLVTRLAQRMGYHRDPKYLPTLTPFEGEIRRRVWSWVETFDLLFSIRLGMPAVVHDEEVDTEIPRNLLEEDFDEDSTELPESRSDCSATPVLFYRYKSQLIKQLRKVSRHVLSIKQSPYEETIKMHEAIEAIHQGAPPSLRMIPIQNSGFGDQPYLFVHRLILEILYLKSLCILHRQYLSFDKHNPKFALSRETCSSAALKILALQNEYNHECKPGGRLYEDRWMLTGLTLHDFLLAAMIICLDISESMSSSPEKWASKLEALKTSRRVWEESNCPHRDGAYASKVLTAMLIKVSGERPPQRDSATGQPAAAAAGALPQGDQLLVNDMSGNSGFQYLPTEPFMPMDLGPMGVWLNDSEQIDWNEVDQVFGDKSSYLNLDLTQQML